jgi:glycosyltransferase involved in cell wall biosynthesis
MLMIMYRERPSIFLGYTIKPNIYGSLATRILGIPTINNIAGLGFVFTNQSWLTYLVCALYRLALSRSATVFFQNHDDREIFISQRLLMASKADLLPGSGVDLVKFFPKPLPNKPPLRFLFIGRMLWDKGVGEFVQAAELLRQQGVAAEFYLLGFLDVQNPTAISRAQMDKWISGGDITYLGVSDDIQHEISKADCVVLPSYREGTPRTLLEAAAMARPIVTTNAVGCRNVVEHGINGYLCKLRDVKDLAHYIKKIVDMTPNERLAMGLKGRQKMEREFDERIVITKYLHAIQLALGP